MELFAQYISERLDQGIVDIPGQGFATFKIERPVVYVADVYVVPELRKTGLASKMVDQIADLGKKQGCSVIKTTVQINTNNSDISETAILAYGFEFDFFLAEKNLKVFKKDI